MIARVIAPYAIGGGLLVGGVWYVKNKLFGGAGKVIGTAGKVVKNVVTAPVKLAGGAISGGAKLGKSAFKGGAKQANKAFKGTIKGAKFTKKVLTSKKAVRTYKKAGKTAFAIAQKAPPTLVAKAAYKKVVPKSVKRKASKAKKKAKKKAKRAFKRVKRLF